MLRIPYEPIAFREHSGDHLQHPGEPRVSWAELAWAAATVGRRRWHDVVRHGVFSSFEVKWRIAMVRANLTADARGSLVKSPAYENLDPSEKSAVSYFLGQVFAKLVAERLFGVSWLLHFDIYAQLLGRGAPLKSRPDFIGHDPAGNWIVLESKGRSGDLHIDVLDKAKIQTLTFRRINGVFPQIRVAIGTQFQGRHLHVTLLDPYEIPDDLPDIAVDVEQAVLAYYKDVISAIRNRDVREVILDGERFSVVEWRELDIEIGLHKALLDASNDARAFREVAFTIVSPSPVLKWIADIQLEPGRQLEQLVGPEPPSVSLEERQGVIFADGVYVRVGTTWG